MIHDLQAARRAMTEANRKRGRGRGRAGESSVRSPFAAVRSVGAQVIEQCATHLNPPVHRTGVQHWNGGSASSQSLMAETVITVVTIKPTEQVLTHAFLLQAQGHHRIRPLECGI